MAFLMKMFQVLSVLHLQDVSNDNVGTYMCTAVFSNEKKSSGTFYLAQTSIHALYISQTFMILKLAFSTFICFSELQHQLTYPPN